MIDTIHRQAVLKLINYFTRTPISPDDSPTAAAEERSGEAQLYRFKEPCDFINLPLISRLGIIISKFDQFFRPSAHLLAGAASASLKSPYNSVNILYVQQNNDLVHYIEVNLFDSIPNIRNEPISVETSQALQNSEHLHALILNIKDWIQQFYIDGNIIPSLFPALNNERTIFKLVEIKENNICVWAILIFNVLYKLRDSFPEYKHVLDFSWSFLFQATMESLIEVVRFDTNFISSLLQTSLLYARMEEEQERQTYAGQYRLIETLQAKIVETKRRSQELAMTYAGSGGGVVGVKGVDKGILVSSGGGTITQGVAPQILTARPTGAGGATKNSRAKSGKRGAAGHAAAAGFLSNSTAPSSSSSRPTTTTSTNPLLNEKPYHCQSCNKTFPTSYKLNRHAYSHSGERPYQCTWPNCEKRFNDNYHLRRHTNTHTGDKPFPCKYPGCTKRYSRSEDLRNHQKTHYPNSGGAGGGGGGGVGSGVMMTLIPQANTATVAASTNHRDVISSLDEHKFILQNNLPPSTSQQQQQLPPNSIAVPLTVQQHSYHTSLPVVTTTSLGVVAAAHQAPLPPPPPLSMSSKQQVEAAQAVAAAAAAGVTPEVLVLNQLQMQLQHQQQQQQQHQHQQSNQQQQQQSGNTFSSLSPGLSDEATTSLLLAAEQQQQQQQSTAAVSVAGQNHVVQAALHSIPDYSF